MAGEDPGKIWQGSDNILGNNSVVIEIQALFVLVLLYIIYYFIHAAVLKSLCHGIMTATCRANAGQPSAMLMASLARRTILILVIKTGNTKNCITCIQCWRNVFDVGLILHKCYTKCFVLLWSFHATTLNNIWTSVRCYYIISID